MNKQNAKRFRQAYLDYQNARNREPWREDLGKSCPINECSANNLTKRIREFIYWSGYTSIRINVMGIARDNRKVVYDVLGHARQVGSMEYRPSGSTKGTADINCTVNGKTIWIEIKYGKDRQSEDQKRFEAEQTKAGAEYWIVRGFDEFLTKWDEYLNSMPC